jgi:hypothetical protein
MNYVQAALRFWWILLAGVAAGLLVLVLSVYRVQRPFPPKLVKKSVPYFVASTELLVDSPTGPYFQTGGTRVTPVVPSVRGATRTTTPTQTTTTVTPPAQLKPLVDAANLFPLFIESDAVTKLRVQKFGDTPGVVTAKALYASQGQNRYRPSSLPVIQINAVSRGPEKAVRLAETTARAFDMWLADEQKRTHVAPAQRIIVRELHAPQGATKQGGTHYGLPAVLGLAVFGAFIGLAVLLDHMFPQRKDRFPGRPIVARSEEETHPSLTVASRSQSR